MEPDINLIVDNAIRKRMKEIGRLGGLATARNRTKRQRFDFASKASKARWKKYKKQMRKKVA